MTATLRVDLLDALTVKELDIASRMLGEDIVRAITAGTAGRWKGLALLAYMTAKRNGDPTAKLADFLDLAADDLVRELARLAGDSALVDELDELEQAEAELNRLAQGDPDAEIAAIEARGNDEGTNRSVGANESAEAADPNPTKRPRESSSRGPGARPRARSRT